MSIMKGEKEEVEWTGKKKGVENLFVLIKLNRNKVRLPFFLNDFEFLKYYTNIPIHYGYEM